MRVLVIRPVVSETPDEVIERQFEVFASTGTEVKAVRLPRGPRSIESRLDIVMAAQGIVERAVEGAAAGYDACIVNCFADPGVGAAREVVRIPVVGPGEASLMMASAVAVRIGVVTVVREVIPIIIENARSSGLSEKLAFVRAVDIPVLDLEDRPKLLGRFVSEAAAAVKEDGAHVIVAGCTGMVDLAVEVREALRAQGIDVPVVDPQGAAMTVAEAMVRLSLQSSPLSYGRPPHKTPRAGLVGGLENGSGGEPPRGRGGRQ